MEVVLTYPTPEGSEEIILEGSKLSLGRGSEADHRIADDGLSRLNSTIYREGSNIWIVDENSTNGTFVNGEAVGSSGTPLHNGDTIKIGNYTSLKVKIAEKQTSSFSAASTGSQQKTSTVSGSSGSSRNLAMLVPVIAISIALFFISTSAVFIAIKVFSNEEPPIVQNNTSDETPEDTPEDEEEKSPTPTATPKNDSGNTSNNSPANGEPAPTNSPETSPQPNPTVNLSGKKYLELSDDEKTKYVEAKLRKIASIIGNRESDDIPPSAVARIKTDVNGYANRIKSTVSGRACSTNLHSTDGLQATYERASKYAGLISRAFMEKQLNGQVGIYVAMIESEHCPCVQSGTGPLGMFQFTYATAVTFFDKGSSIVKGSKPPTGDDRCNPEIAARGSAKYVKYLMDWFGSGPNSFPLAIASYNSGEGMLRQNLKKALDADPSMKRNFWTLIANADKLTQQFQDENFKYPPKFFAAAIVGENPQDFGLNIQPLSYNIK